MFRSNGFFLFLKLRQLFIWVKNWSTWKHLNDFGSFISDQLRCSVWVFIPVVFIIFSSILLCIRFASKPGMFIGHQLIQVKGQLVCCANPFFANASIRNYPHQKTNCTRIKPPIFNVKDFAVTKTNILGNILNVAMSNFTTTEEIQSRNLDCYDSDEIYTSHCLIFRHHRIELYDFDWLTTDDFLNETHTDENGVFELSGHVNEIFPMLPYIVILHRCFDSKSQIDEHGNRFDYRKSYYSVAPYYVNKGTHYLFPLNLQTLGWRDIHTVED